MATALAQAPRAPGHYGPGPHGQHGRQQLCDIFVAFSTANSQAAVLIDLTMLPNVQMDKLFEATIQATEEAIINALIAAETMTGRDAHQVLALPHQRLRDVLMKYNRLIR